MLNSIKGNLGPTTVCGQCTIEMVDQTSYWWLRVQGLHSKYILRVNRQIIEWYFVAFGLPCCNNSQGNNTFFEFNRPFIAKSKI